MNDVAVKAIWFRLEALEARVERMHFDLLKVEGRIRARLKEEAEARRIQIEAFHHDAHLEVR